MTKEELKQEAEEKAKKRTKGFKCQDNCEKSYVMGALDFAEPREKRIEELETNYHDLFVQFNQRIAEIEELQGQIEKMKNQWNCKNNNGHCVSSICPCKDRWELRR